MTIEEVKELFEKMRIMGITDEEIISRVFTLYKEEKMSFDEFETIALLLGFEVKVEIESITKEEYEQCENAICVLS